MIFEVMSVNFLEDDNYVETLHENVAGTKFVLAVSCFSSQYGFRQDFFFSDSTNEGATAEAQ